MLEIFKDYVQVQNEHDGRLEILSWTIDKEKEECHIYLSK